MALIARGRATNAHVHITSTTNSCTMQKHEGAAEQQHGRICSYRRCRFGCVWLSETETPH